MARDTSAVLCTFLLAGLLAVTSCGNMAAARREEADAHYRMANSFLQQGRGFHDETNRRRAYPETIKAINLAPDNAHYHLLLGTLYALLLAVAGRGWWGRSRPLVLWLAAAGIGFLLAAPQLLPSLELSRMGLRREGLTIEAATRWNLEPKHQTGSRGRSLPPAGEHPTRHGSPEREGPSEAKCPSPG